MVKTLVRSLVVLAFLVSLSASGAEGSPDSTLPPYRYLIVVDTSAAMSRQKDVAVDTVNKLIASGINDRIQTGDLLGVWTVADKLNKGAFGPKLWVTDERTENASRVAQVLRDAKYSKAPNLGPAIDAIKEAARASGSLTIFLLTSGTVPVAGTSFDAEINAVFQQHSVALRKVEKPFVVVFSAQDGELFAQAVSPGGGRLFIPPVRKPPLSLVSDDDVYGIKRESNSVAETTVARIPSGGATRSETNAPKTLSAAEIAEILKQQQMERANALAAAAAANATLTNSPTVQSVPVSRSAESAGTKAASPGPGEGSRIPIDAPALAATPPATSTGISIEAGDNSRALPDSASRPAGKADAPPSHPHAGVATVAATESPGAGTASDVEPQPRSSVEPQTATIIPPPSPAKSRRYLMFAAVLFVFVAILSWLLMRWNRAASHPSLITRSLRERRR